MLIFLAIIFSLFLDNAIARTTLTASDLEFVGAFKMPAQVGPSYAETQYGSGLALRRVNGEVRLFSGTWSAGVPDLYEVTIPTLTTSAPWNAAPVERVWGQVLTDRLGNLQGLYWDETDSRLYYTSSWDYPGDGDDYRPTLAYLTLDDNNGTATSYGRWGYTNRSFRQVNFGLTAIPSDFATEYLDGKRLAAGFGGYQSLISRGPVSLGPSLTAFNPPTTEPAGGYLSNTPLVGYGGSGSWTSGSRPTVNRAWRDDDVIHDIYENIGEADGSTQNTASYWHLTGDESFYWQGYSVNGLSREGYPDYVTFDESAIVTKHWEPGNAFWNTDYIFQSATWIQTANKEGFLLLGMFDTGHVWYWESTSHAEGMNYKWLIYSREQLASVAQGVTGEDDIQPSRYDTDLREHSGVVSLAHSGISRYSCTGMVFDPVDSKLYVAIQFASNAPTMSATWSTHLIYVYNIKDTLSPNIPPWKSNAFKFGTTPVRFQE